VQQDKIKKILVALIISSAVIRIVLASILELTNDEASYWLYALYPSLSHFDHPPMVGFFIQFFSVNLLFKSELFLRLSSVVVGTVNTYLIFLIGRKIKDDITGLTAAFLYTASLYAFVITGIFIQPDTPMILFWMMSLYFIINIFGDNEITAGKRKSFLLVGLLIGLAVLSKYHGAYLWAAIGAYILLYDRKWLKVKELYIAILITLICTIPIIIWNVQNNFISFTFQGERVDVFKSGLQFNFFFQEFFGQMFYNNPVNFIIIILALFKLKSISLNKNYIRLLIITGLPLIILFLLFSLFRRTLPHWSGPAYISMIMLASVFLKDKINLSKRLIPLPVKLSVVLMLVIIIFGAMQINYGVIFLKESSNNPTELGKNDFTLDMYGWKQAGEKFNELNKRFVTSGKISSEASLIGYKWYNSAHIDYYIGTPLNKSTFAAGRLDEIRNLNWINIKRGGIENVKEAYYISPTRDYKDPNEVFKNMFRVIEPIDTIRIERAGKIVENVFVYIMKK
jgi:hypothetical protein